MATKRKGSERESDLHRVHGMLACYAAPRGSQWSYEIKVDRVGAGV